MRDALDGIGSTSSRSRMPSQTQENRHYGTSVSQSDSFALPSQNLNLIYYPAMADLTYNLNGGFKPTMKRFADLEGADFFPTPRWATLRANR